MQLFSTSRRKPAFSSHYHFRSRFYILNCGGRRQTYAPLWTSYVWSFSHNESKRSKSKAPPITKTRNIHSRNRERYVIVAVIWLNYCRHRCSYFVRINKFSFASQKYMEKYHKGRQRNNLSFASCWSLKRPNHRSNLYSHKPTALRPFISCAGTYCLEI